MTETSNFKLKVIDFEKNPWHEDFHDNMYLIDAILAQYLVVTNIVGVWKNATDVSVGERYVDSDAGTVWTVLIAHTTHSTRTFAEDRAVNTTYWQSYSTEVNGMGAWAASTVYSINDFVVYDSDYYVCTTAHTSTTSFDATKFTLLVDSSLILAGLDAAVASATASATSATAAAVAAQAAVGGVKVSTNDTTADVLTEKLTAGTAITLTELADGGDEYLRVAVSLGTSSTQAATGDHLHTGVYEPVDATILKDADIGSSVQAYAANLTTLSSKTFVDEDDMASDSATAIPSQQSVKAYIDGNSGGFPSLTVYTSSGTWSKPAGLKGIEVIVIGGGGGGGAYYAPSSYTGGQGGGGGISREYIPAASLGATESYTVGAGGTSNATGGTSSFGTAAFLSATGGGGGTSPTMGAHGNGGGGGSGVDGDLNFKGLNGGSPGSPGADWSIGRPTLGQFVDNWGVGGAGSAGGPGATGGAGAVIIVEWA